MLKNTSLVAFALVTVVAIWASAFRSRIFSGAITHPETMGYFTVSLSMMGLTVVQLTADCAGTIASKVMDYAVNNKLMRDLFAGAYQQLFAQRVYDAGIVEAMLVYNDIVVNCAELAVRIFAVIIVCGNLNAAVYLVLCAVGLFYTDKYINVVRKKVMDPLEVTTNVTRSMYARNARRDGVRMALKPERARVMFVSLFVGADLVPRILMHAVMFTILWYYGMRSGDIARVTNIDALVWQIGWSIIMLSRCYRNMMDNHSHEFKLYAELKGHATRGVAQEMRAPNVEKVIVRHLDYRIASSGRSFSLGARDVEVVRGANVLIDQSGAGKSTFAGLFCDSVDHDAVRVFECEIVYEDGVSEKISGADAICTFARHCCSFPQERDRQPKRKVKVREWMCVQKDDDFRANHIMREMGLTSIGLDMEIGENFAMSPGEWTRMLLARTIIADHLDTARFVVFDEPDGSIDSATTRIVIPLLMEMARNAIIVIISHNSCTQELLQDCAHLHFKCESDGAGAKKSDVTSDMV